MAVTCVAGNAAVDRVVANTRYVLDAAGAGTVVDDDDAEALLRLLREQARDDVERSAGRIRNDEAKWLRLRERAAEQVLPPQHDLPLAKVMRPPHFVPDSKKVNEDGLTKP